MFHITQNFHIFQFDRRLLQRAKTDTLFRWDTLMSLILSDDNGGAGRQLSLLWDCEMLRSWWRWWSSWWWYSWWWWFLFGFRIFACRRLIVLPPAHLYHFYEAKIKFRVMNLGKVLMILLATSFKNGRSKHHHSLQVRMAAVPRLGEKLTVLLQPPFPTLFLSININVNMNIDRSINKCTCRRKAGGGTGSQPCSWNNVLCSCLSCSG